MHTWMWLVLLAFGLIKLPLAALMLWIPFRSDAAVSSNPLYASDESNEDEGGSKVLPGGAGGPRVSPHPRPRTPLGGRGPRRGPHGGAAGRRPASPARVRGARRGATRVRARQ
jgi:hypothetical protein